MGAQISRGSGAEILGKVEEKESRELKEVREGEWASGNRCVPVYDEMKPKGI